MAKKLYVHEVLKLVAEAKSRDDKRKVLWDNNTLALRDVLKGSFCDDITWTIPKGNPPFEAAKPGQELSSLEQQTKKLRYFVKGGPGDELKSSRREAMFIDILMSVHPEDAKVLLTMKDKLMVGQYKGLTKKLAAETFVELKIK